MSIKSVGLLVGFVAASAGVAMAAEAPPPPFAWQGVTELATGPAEMGPWQQNQSRYDYVDDPTVAIDDRGSITVAWVNQARKDIFVQRFSGNGVRPRGEPVNVSRNVDTFSWLPRIALAPDSTERMFVLWQEIIFSGGSHGGDILFARSEDGGASFSAPINLSRSIGGDGKGRINKEIWHNGSLDLAAGADGTVYAAWTEYHGPLWLARSTDGGESFSSPRLIAGGEGGEPTRGPALALGPDGVVYLAWTTGTDEAADIHLAKSTDGGATFSKPQIIAANDTYSDAPKLAVDGTGMLHLVYAESEAGPFARYVIRYTRSTDGGRTFDAPRDISEPAPGDGESSAFPYLDTDAKGNIYVLWALYPDHRKPPRGLGIAVSRDGGRNFTRPALVPRSRGPAGSVNGSQQGLLMDKLSVNGGDVAIVNSSFKRGEHSRVWLIRGSSMSPTEHGRPGMRGGR